MNLAATEKPVSSTPSRPWIDVGLVQDAYHYALAAAGIEGAFGFIPAGKRGKGFDGKTRGEYLRLAWTTARAARLNLAAKKPRSLADAETLACSIASAAKDVGVDAWTGERL